MTLSSSMILVDQIAVTLATPEVLAALGGAVSEGQRSRTANILALACALFGAFHRRRWPPDAGGAFGARARHHHPGPPGPCLSPMGRFIGGAHAVGSGLWASIHRGGTTAGPRQVRYAGARRRAMLPRHEGVGRLVRRDGGITRPTPPGARGRPGFGGRFAVALSGPGLVREGGGAGAGAASRLRRGARPGRIFMRLSFCGLWTQNDERVGLGGPRWPSGAPSFVMTTAPEGVRWLSSRPRLGRAFEPTGYALHRKRFARPRRRRVPAPPNGGARTARRHHPGRPCPRYGSLHRKRCSLDRCAARHGRPRARPARLHPSRPAGGRGAEANRRRSDRSRGSADRVPPAELVAQHAARRVRGPRPAGRAGAG
jgi:hypothetical protein